VTLDETDERLRLQFQHLRAVRNALNKVRWIISLCPNLWTPTLRERILDYDLVYIKNFIRTHTDEALDKLRRKK
jgi:hypothetical protein